MIDTICLIAISWFTHYSAHHEKKNGKRRRIRKKASCLLKSERTGQWFQNLINNVKPISQNSTALPADEETITLYYLKYSFH